MRIPKGQSLFPSGLIHRGSSVTLNAEQPWFRIIQVSVLQRQTKPFTNLFTLDTRRSLAARFRENSTPDEGQQRARAKPRENNIRDTKRRVTWERWEREKSLWHPGYSVFDWNSNWPMVIMLLAVAIYSSWIPTQFETDCITFPGSSICWLK